MSTARQTELLETQNHTRGFVEVTTSNSPASGSFSELYVAVASTAFSATSAIGDDLSSITLNNGDTIKGDFSQVTVTAGRVLAFNK